MGYIIQNFNQKRQFLCNVNPYMYKILYKNFSNYGVNICSFGVIKLQNLNLHLPIIHLRSHNLLTPDNTVTSRYEQM